MKTPMDAPMDTHFPDLARRRLGALVLGLWTCAAVAAPPPGHPSPDGAMRLLQPAPAPEEFRSGQVLSHVDANEYTYVEVMTAGERLWLAAPRTALKDGEPVRFPAGVVFRDFYSKLLKRSFPALMFVDSVEPAADR